MTIIGIVDGMAGRYVVGWAADLDDLANPEGCQITILDESGKVIAQGQASQPRDDLTALKFGRTTLAFSIPLDNPPTPRTLDVRANGRLLANAALVTGLGHFDGVASQTKDLITGWVTERAMDFSAPFVRIVNQHGLEVGRGQAERQAQDADPMFRPARFSIVLDDACFGAGEQLLSICAGTRQFASLTCHLTLQGNLEILSTESCFGWLVAPIAPARRLCIEIFCNGVLAGTATCDQPRPDVQAVFPEAPNAGFFTGLQRQPDHGLLDATTVSLRLAGTATEIFEGPYLLAGRAGAIAAAQRMAGLAYKTLPGIGPAERAVIGLAFGDFIAKTRATDGFKAPRQAIEKIAAARPGLLVIIAVYRDLAATTACIESVLAQRDPADMILLINDASPEPMMAGMLAGFARSVANLFVLTNQENLGYVRSINRGIAFSPGADVLLLNADTVVFAGACETLCAIAATNPAIGTVTAMSNNATIFSYPHADLACENLSDITWPELAQIALVENRQSVFDVPTGHGFCLLIKREVLHRLGPLDEAYGRGYGEENDFCARAATLGYKNVAAAGVLVEHKESLSFTAEKPGLLASNMPRLHSAYPEYNDIISAFERLDGLRQARWALDRARLARALAGGQRFALLVSNALDGGTSRATADIAQATGYGGATALQLRATPQGPLELSTTALRLRAVFAADEITALFDMLDAADPTHVLVHQILGFPEAFIRQLPGWAASRHSIFYAHDFYSLCPRVTMIDAIGRFCDIAAADTCTRCLQLGGAHEHAKLSTLTPAAHRAMFADFLGGFRHLVAPSGNAAAYLRRGFPDIAIETLPHPEMHDTAIAPRAGSDTDIILLGAIGPHKGSEKLLELARRARLTQPALHFTVIGYTNLDAKLLAIGNVTVTGPYYPENATALLAAQRGRLALFLPAWPETYSYTLSEVVRSGYIPLVPDIGAPAERVRAAGYGVVFPFPADPAGLLELLGEIAAGRQPLLRADADAGRFFATPAVVDRHVDLLAR
jgi:GT2 family glycosyltransferase/glycosyltransferase involved in cell wall biosynthesis